MTEMDISEKIGRLIGKVDAVDANIDVLREENKRHSDKQEYSNAQLIGFRADHDATVLRVDNLENNHVFLKKDVSRLEKTYNKFLWICAGVSITVSSIVGVVFIISKFIKEVQLWH